ncbi:MAG: tetratricopeptide repeat protein, partial [Myxococcota bacterium]
RGLGGIGKTSLARAVGAAVARRGLAATVHVDLEDVTDPHELLERVAGALDLDGTDRVARIRRALGGRAPLLLVLDDLDGLDDAAESAVGPLLDVPGVSVLVTARRATGGTETLDVPLSPLTPEASRQLLGQTAIDAGATAEAYPPEELDALCEALDHLPLALVLAGRWLPHVSPRALLRSVDDLSSGDGSRRESLTACLTASWERLDPQARGDLIKLSTMGARTPLELARAVVGADAWSRIDALRQRSLVSLEDDQVGIVGSVRRFASAHATGALRRAVTDAWGRWAIATATTFDGIDSPGAIRRLAGTLRHVLAGLDERPPDPRWHDAVAAVTRMQLVVGLDERIDARMARWVADVREAGDREALGRALHLRGLVGARTGRDALPDLREAQACLGEASELGGHVAVDLGARLRALQQVEASQALLQEVLTRAQRQGHRILEARARLELGMVFKARGAYDRSVDALTRAGTLARQLDHQRLEMMATGARASCERMLGRSMEAEILTRRALAAAEALADRENAAHLRGNLANLCAADGRVPEALRLCRQARDHYRAHGHVRSEGFALLTLGICEMVLGHLDEARTQLLASEDAFAVGAVPLGEACARANLGRLRHHAGDPAGAVTDYGRALARLGDPSTALGTRIRALRALARIESGAEDQAREALAGLDPTEPLVELALQGLDTEPRTPWAAQVRELLGSHRLEGEYRWR